MDQEEVDQDDHEDHRNGLRYAGEPHRGRTTQSESAATGAEDRLLFLRRERVRGPAERAGPLPGQSSRTEVRLRTTFDVAERRRHRVLEAGEETGSRAGNSKSGSAGAGPP